MQVVRRSARLAVIVAGALGVTTCQVADLLRPAGAKDVLVAYTGDSILVQGRTVATVAVATAGGTPLSGAQFVSSSSDTSVLAVQGGDTLVALKRGAVALTVTLAGAILPQNPPAVTRTIRVVAAYVRVDSARVTFASLGDSVTLHATAYDADSAAIPGAATWVSSDTTVVTATAGRLTAVKNGTATVRATVDFDTAATTVTVRQTLAHFTFDQASLLIDAIGAAATVTPTARDARGNAIAGVAPAWSSGDTSVASVSPAGTATGVRTGTTYLYARQGTVVDSLQVTVTQRPTRVAISPKPVLPITALNNQRQLSAAAYDRRNVLIPSPSVAWSVTDPTIVSVTPQGLLTALAVGSVRLYASAGAALDSVTVTVTNLPASVRIAPHTATSTSTGDTLVFAAAAFNSRGDTVPGTVFSWRTPDTAVVRVAPDSAFVKGTGTGRVIAAAGSLADTATITATNQVTTLHFTLPQGQTVGPLQRSLTAIGDVDAPPVVIQNARNATLSRGSVTWSVDNPLIASVTALGVVTARDTGQTLVRISGNGLTDSALYTLTNTPTSVVIEGRAKDTLTALGQILPFAVTVRNHRNAVISNYPVTWRSTNIAVADTVIRDTVTAKGFGTTSLIVTAGTVADTFTLVVRRLTRWTADNSSVVSPRVGSALRPYAQIQDAVNAAGAKDTVVVKVGAGAYSETVALSRSLTILGDSTAFVTGAHGNPGQLPLIGHDSGSAGIVAFTSAPMTLRYLALRHSLDGPAIQDSGSDVKIEYFYVNPAGSVTSRIGRGISIKNSVSGTSIMRSEVDSVRGYGIRLQSVSNATISVVVVRGVDSLPGIEEGAGIKAIASTADVIHANFVRRAQIGVLVGGASSNVQVDNNDVTTNTWGMRLDAGAVSAASTGNDIYSNDSAGVVNPLGTSLSFPSNWWGDGAGPRNSGNLAATGDSAVGNIASSTVKKAPTYAGTAATGLLIVRGNNQSALANNNLPLALTARVVDANGFPVAGVSVTFSTTGQGRINNQSPGASVQVTSDVDGLAQVTFRLDPTPGQNTITVTGTTLGLGSVTFNATGL